MALDFHFGPSLENLTGRIDEKRRPLNALRDLAVHILFDNHSERVAQLRVDVRNQFERNVILVFELLMRGDRVAAHTDDLNTFALETCVGVAKLRRFVRSTGCVVFGIKP